MTGDHISRRGSVVRFRNPSGRWLHTGWDGGEFDGDTAYSISVPSGWNPDEIAGDVSTRLAAVGFDAPGPALLTGVGVEHARVARCQSVRVFATAGLSNPAPLPIPGREPVAVPNRRPGPPVGTVNLAIWTDRKLAPGARVNAIAVAAEAKAATLTATVGVPGTSTDAILIGDRPDGDQVPYSGSSTDLGMAIRVGVRDAVLASLESKYDPVDESIVENPEYPVEEPDEGSKFQTHIDTP